MSDLIKAISEGMHEREEVISVSLLAALCGQNTFLYGPPGTAKSLISRRISCAFHQPAYFECLMNRFSTPEEVFGPVSIKALKEDCYTRQTASYLPKAEFAFLDEIWKSSPAILNTLLTLINERTFKNGEIIETAPLKALIAASNEIPDVNQGLEALYDRFIVRLWVPPIVQQQNFEHLLQVRPSSAVADVPQELRITSDEWAAWQSEIHSVTLSSETLTIIHLVRHKLAAQQDGGQPVYVSDRRWQRAAMLMKAAAFFNGRSSTNHSDALLLQHCLWTDEENRPDILQFVADAVQEAGLDSGLSLAEIDRKKEDLDREIHRELYYSEDFYETECVSGKDFFKFECKFNYFRLNEIASRSGGYIMIPLEKMKTRDRFYPTNISGNKIDFIQCQFDGQGNCRISCNSGEHATFTPEVLFKKGDKKSGVDERLVSALQESLSGIKGDISQMLATAKKMFSDIEASHSSIFVPVEKTNLAFSGIAVQIEQLKQSLVYCERLEKRCR
ncbi:AAA family ATPase [Insolitispirillum peregrinum]|uniref:AAA family ATPase n=1 Tax=Insolitispirillum peregrinum TaxID=80876 RepID=UPI001C375AAD|nr:AAA family ATPase [Insolitispirillum peregrinum]